MAEQWLTVEIADDIDSQDAARIAHRLGGIVANDTRIREAIQLAIDAASNEQAILRAVAKVLTE
jgi:hypothetical protein